MDNERTTTVRVLSLCGEVEVLLRATVDNMIEEDVVLDGVVDCED